ncbi:MAG: hypothetical protein ACTSU5_19540 [Promethearchaeota archaeon]
MNAKYFSPDVTPGTGDTVLHYFSVNNASDYNLNVTAYYRAINRQTSFGGSSHYLGAFRMDNGTWFVVMNELDITTGARSLVFGIGPNASTLEWHDIGPVNYTVLFRVAAVDEKLRVVYFEPDAAETHVEYVRCYTSNDYGQTWFNETLWNCSAWGDVWLPSMSLGIHGGTFECLWSFSNISISSQDAKNLTTIWECRDAGAGWSTPGNLTALEGENGYAPQVFSNGTLYVAYTDVNVTTGIKGPYSQEKTVLMELGNGVDAAATATWDVTDIENCSLLVGSAYGVQDPSVYCAKDLTQSEFYFVKEGEDGIKSTSTWGANLSAVPLDFFVSESGDSYFALFGDGGAKCFTSEAISEGGFRRPGILECLPSRVLPSRVLRL